MLQLRMGAAITHIHWKWVVSTHIHWESQGLNNHCRYWWEMRVENVCWWEPHHHSHWKWWMVNPHSQWECRPQHSTFLLRPDMTRTWAPSWHSWESECWGLNQTHFHWEWIVSMHTIHCWEWEWVYPNPPSKPLTLRIDLNMHWYWEWEVSPPHHIHIMPFLTAAAPVSVSILYPTMISYQYQTLDLDDFVSLIILLLSLLSSSS